MDDAQTVFASPYPPSYSTFELDMSKVNNLISFVVPEIANFIHLAAYGINRWA